MTLLESAIEVSAPIEICFDLSLSIDLEQQAVGSGLKAIAGVTTGLIGLHQQVQWRAVQFGIPVYHLTEITRLERPAYFQDAMIKGVFRSFHHDHWFSPITPDRTLMRDKLAFSMPLQLFGRVSERLLVSRRMRTLLDARNALIRRTAEAMQRRT